MTNSSDERRDEMAHVIVRRLGHRYVAEIAGNSDLHAEGDSAVEALRRMREVLEDRVNNRSIIGPGSR